MGMAKSLGEDVPFNMLSGSEIFRWRCQKPKLYLKHLEEVGVRIKEEAEKVEGEVVEIKINK